MKSVVGLETLEAWPYTTKSSGRRVAKMNLKISSCYAAGTILKHMEYGRSQVPNFINCCNEPSRATWLKLMAKFQRKLQAGAKRDVTVKTKLESRDQIAHLMSIRPGWDKSDELQ